MKQLHTKDASSVAISWLTNLPVLLLSYHIHVTCNNLFFCVADFAANHTTTDNVSCMLEASQE